MLPEIERNPKIIESNRERVTLTPSRDLAWMVGTLAGTGSVKIYRNRDGSTSSSISLSWSGGIEGLLKTFQTVGENIFRLNSRLYKKHSNGFERSQVVFFSRQIASTLGNLNLGSWDQTIMDLHRWILESQNYTWAFLGGLLDTTGYVRIDKRKRIVFKDYHMNTANFTADLLVRVGIQRPNFKKDRRAIEGISGIIIENVRDLKTIAENIHSEIPYKEERLQFLRTLDPQSSSFPNFPSSKEDIVQEWVKLKNLLGHVPRRDEVFRARKERKTRFSPEVYTHRFSLNNSFAVTKMVIERIIQEGRLPSEEELSLLIQQYQREEEAGALRSHTPPNDNQIRSDNQIRRRLDNISGIKQPDFIHEGLFGPDGKTVILPPLKRTRRRLTPIQTPIPDQPEIEVKKITDKESSEEPLPTSGINELVFIRIPRIGNIFNELGYASRKIISLLSQSMEPIPSSQLAKDVYGERVNLTDGRQKVRMSIYDVLNPRLRENGYIIVNVNEIKTHKEAIYGLTSMEYPDQTFNIEYEDLLRYNPREDIFELTLPDEQIFRSKYMFYTKLVELLIRERREIPMEELAREFYGDYDRRASDNVGHLVRKTASMLESLGWHILQTTTPQQLRLGNKAKYSLVKK